MDVDSDSEALCDDLSGANGLDSSVSQQKTDIKQENMMEVRCCCSPENLMGELPEGLPYPTRELNDGTFAYVAHSIPPEVLQSMPHRKGKGKSKTWRKTKRKK